MSKKKNKVEKNRKIIIQKQSGAIQKAFADIFSSIGQGFKNIGKFFKKYHVPIFTFFISVCSSVGVVAFSSLGGEKMFPSYWLGFMLILILEFGFVTLRYIAVAIGATRTIMVFINIFMVFLFILTVAPAIIGINQKVQEDRRGPGTQPVKSDLINSLEINNAALNKKIEANTKIMTVTSVGKIFQDMQEENNKLLSDIEANKKIITEKNNEYEQALRDWNNKKTIAESKDPFVVFMRDFYLRFMIPGVQILNLFMSILGAGYLKRIKEGKTRVKRKQSRLFIFFDALFNRLLSRAVGPIVVPSGITDRLGEHELKLKNIEAHTEKLKKDMVELAGELDKAEIKGPVKARNTYKDKKIEEQTTEASKPVFFKTNLEIGGKKKKDVDWHPPVGKG